MDFSWKIVIDAGIISAALLLATFLRAKLHFLQRLMVPNALTAGFILLPIYNFLFPYLGYTVNKLGDLVYHLLNLSFIAMTLRANPKQKKKNDGAVLATTSVILSQYALQALAGLLLSWLLFTTIMPKLNLAIGLTLPLGYSLGPGQAYAIGKGWEAIGFEGAGSVGLTMAALGFLWACIVGVIMVNHGIKKGYLSKDLKTEDKALRTGIIPEEKEKPISSRATTSLEAIDPLSYHAALVAVTYFLSYLLLSLISFLLGLLGKTGTELANNLWGINFIFSALTAMIVRKIIVSLRIEHVIDNDSLSRVSGFSVDYMVTGALAAISLVFVSQYWLPILLIGLVGGIITTATVPWLCSRIFYNSKYERMLMLYGVATGTLSTGLALLRIVDPEFKTRVSGDYMVSAGLTFALAIPFILSINLPVGANAANNFSPFWLMILVSSAYLLFSIISFLFVAKKNAFRNISQIWLKD
ncbi:MAG TPA: sodium/glutamate symporter [Treponemataceae bacterium]|nr:sodium/glutamate symporter [Treponemataceae bacterium]